MRLVKLRLQNFRCFDKLVVDFDPRLTVIVAENGAGKTSILDAIAIGFGRIITKLPGVSGIASKETDLRIDKSERRSPFLFLGWEAVRQDKQALVWAAGRKRDASVKAAAVREELDNGFAELLDIAFKQINAYTAGLAEAAAKGEAFFLPVIAYYGTNRAILEEVQRRRNFKTDFSRFDALSGALQPDARFKAAFEWFTAMEDVERREREARRSFEYRLPALEVVRGAISRMIDDCSNPRTVIRPLRFLIDRCAPDGTVRSLRVTQLSDGYRVVLGLVMDLARRMAQANSELVPGGNEIVNPLDLPAVVLIDEVDLHLHPRWQQRIVGDLMRTFPGAQFIVTTHSPQVLSSVPASSIRVLQSTTDPESGSQVFRADVIEEQTQGVASNDVLSRIMGVDPVPDVLQARQLSEFRAMIQREQDRTEAGQALRAQLVEHFGPSHPEISELDRLVRLATFKRTLPKRG
jgi:predicted ATP-binding protein involved in virulence